MLLDRPVPARPRAARPWLWWAGGTLALVLALAGPWAVPPAAWVFAIFLLRFARSRRVLPGVVGVWFAYLVAETVAFATSGLPLVGPFPALALLWGSVLVVPYLLDRLLLARLGPGLPATSVFPTAMVGAEYVLGAASPLGTVLASLGTTQHAVLPLIQLASLTGTYGVSFLLAWLAPIVLLAAEQGVRAMLAYTAVLVLVLVSGTVRLALAPAPPTVRVAAVSPSVVVDAALHDIRSRYASARALGGDPAAVGPVFGAIRADLLASTAREAAAGARIVVWPEAGAPVLEDDRAALVRQIADVATHTGAYIDAGMIVLTHDAPFFARNEALLVDPSGRVVWTYDKARPVPGMDRIAPGDGHVPDVDTPVGRLATAICFDADFPDLMRRAAGTDLMLVPSNDWERFGRTHTDMAAMRAVENGYSLIRSDSHGVSGAFDPLGRSVGSANWFATPQQTMVGSVPDRGIRTVYSQIGDVFAWLCLVGLAVLGVVAARRGR